MQLNYQQEFKDIDKLSLINTKQINNIKMNLRTTNIDKKSIEDKLNSMIG